MKQSLIADYLSCILFRFLSFFTAFLPLNFSLFLGRRLGDLIYLFDRRHRAIAYANIRKTVADKLDCASSARITRRAYQSFGQNIIEISFIPRINKRYLEKYIQIENKDYIGQAFARGKGVIFLIVHEGNWELSNIICANLGFPFLLFVRDQGFPRLNALLNSYRLKQGAMIIHKEGGIRQLVEALRSNQAVGMTVDQGGKNGERVKFFGKEASMSVGAVKLAVRLDCSIIPVFYTRIKGPYTKVILDQVYTATRTGDPENDLRENLQRLINIYEGYIRKYPYEYLWTYKIWKYGLEREILILSDGKTGHLHQSQGLAKLIGRQLARCGIKYNLTVQEIKFRSRLAEFIFNWVSWGCLRYSLTKESWQDLVSFNPDIIISAGGAISKVNYLLSKENQAKSIVLMRPANLALKKFNLVIMPEHDWPQSHRPPQRKNVVVTEGALNLIDADYLSQKSQRLKQSNLWQGPLLNSCIGLLIGGDSKKFTLNRQDIIEVSGQIKKSAEELNVDVLLSTSRRTSSAIEQSLKNEFADYARCKLMIMANESNNPDVIGAILGLSSIIICSPESISMISEAACAGKYVVVFKGYGLSKKHERFLKNYQDRGYIYLKEAKDLASGIKELWLGRPKINVPQDKLRVIEALNKIL